MHESAWKLRIHIQPSPAEPPRFNCWPLASLPYLTVSLQATQCDRKQCLSTGQRWTRSSASPNCCKSVAPYTSDSDAAVYFEHDIVNPSSSSGLCHSVFGTKYSPSACCWFSIPSTHSETHSESEIDPVVALRDSPQPESSAKLILRGWSCWYMVLKTASLNSYLCNATKAYYLWGRPVRKSKKRQFRDSSNIPRCCHPR